MFRSYLAAVRELPRPPRLFLIFTAVNVFSWQCIAGPAMVLFARALNMPPAWVGLLLSFLPISMLLVVFTVPLVEWLGPRKLLLWTWLARNVLSLSVFLVPWAVSRWGEAGGWQVLLFATLAFSLIRAVGVGAWYPWLHEIVPRPLLGSYLSIEAAMSQVIIIALALAMALILGLGQGLGRFFLLYAAGIGAGFWSVQLIGKIPGGERVVATDFGLSGRSPSLRQALADQEYRRFFVLAMLGTGSVMWLNAASVMYLRDMLFYSEAKIMLLLAAGGIGVACTVHFWGRAADRFGSVPAMIQLLGAHALLAFCWWGLHARGGSPAFFRSWLIRSWILISSLATSMVGCPPERDSLRVAALTTGPASQQKLNSTRNIGIQIVFFRMAAWGMLFLETGLQRLSVS